MMKVRQVDWVNNRSTYVMIACLIVFLGGGLYYFLREEPLPPQEEVKQARADTQNLILSGNTLVEEKNGKRKWELTAEGIEVDNNNNQVIFKNIKGTIFQDNGEKTEFTAQNATMDTKIRDILMSGDVKAIASNGTVLTANQMKWLAQKEHLYGSGGVVITKEDIVITGDTVDSDAKIEKVRVQGNAHVIRKGGN